MGVGFCPLCGGTQMEFTHWAHLTPLGDVICAFKSRVVHEYIAKVKAGEWPRFAGNIWHRNYYEMIVRDEDILVEYPSK